jgi:FkbM family methyltransferase
MTKIDEKIDTRIDFKTAEKTGQLDLIDWPTAYGDFKFYVRKGLNEVKYNVHQNFSKNPKGGEYIRPFVHEKMGTPLNIDEVLNQEDVWLDVGGHLGFFAIRMLKQFPKIKNIVSYEALPHNVTFAIENLKINDFQDKCQMVQAAIMPNDEKVIDFFISKDSGKHSTLQVRGREVIQVPAVNINDVIEEVKPTAIKVDIEGAEYQLLPAIKDWSGIRVAIIEWHFNAIKPLDGSKQDETFRSSAFRECIQMFKDNGFDTIRKIPGVEDGKNWITHFVALKTK